MTMALKQLLLVVTVATCVVGQRPFFAGTRPIGYPAMVPSTVASAAASEDLGNRFGDDNVTTTTQRLPIEANGDRDLVDRLSKLPVDKQPFWFINWQALEANRKNPQTYPQRPSQFAQSFHPTSAPTNSALTNVNTAPASVPANSNLGLQNNVDVTKLNNGFGNRNAEVTGSSVEGNPNPLENKNGNTSANFNSNEGSTLKPVNNDETANRFAETASPSTQVTNIDSSLGNKYSEDSTSKGSAGRLDHKGSSNVADNENVNKNFASVPTPDQELTPPVQSQNVPVNPIANMLFHSQPFNRYPVNSNINQGNINPAAIHPIQSVYPVVLDTNRYRGPGSAYFDSSVQIPIRMPDVGHRYNDDDYDFEIGVHPQVQQQSYYSKGNGGFSSDYY